MGRTTLVSVLLKLGEFIVPAVDSLPAICRYVPWSVRGMVIVNWLSQLASSRWWRTHGGSTPRLRNGCSAIQYPAPLLCRNNRCLLLCRTCHSSARWCALPQEKKVGFTTPKPSYWRRITRNCKCASIRLLCHWILRIKTSQYRATLNILLSFRNATFAARTSQPCKTNTNRGVPPKPCVYDFHAALGSFSAQMRTSSRFQTT